MPLSTPRRVPASRFSTARARTRFALQLAARAHAAIDRRMSEASALVAWLNENAASLPLAEVDLPEENIFLGRRRFLSAPEWHSVGAAIVGPVADGVCTTGLSPARFNVTRHDSTAPTSCGVTG